MQGESKATIDKERRIASALSIGMSIASSKLSWCTFFHFDANAGCGWNKEMDVPGSPLVFHQMAGERLNGMKRKAFFCDKNKDALNELKTRLQSNPEYFENSYLLPGDNEEALEVFAEYVRRNDKPKYAMGSFVVDPNGYLYRNAQGIGSPSLSSLTSFSKEFERIDFILNLNTRIYRLQRSHGHDVISPVDIFQRLKKKHWIIGRTQYGGNEYLLAVGRNLPTGDHKSIGLHKVESPEGRFILAMVEGNRQGRLAI